MKSLALAALAAALAGPAAAQSTGDGWDLETDAAQDAVVASVVYDGGVGVAVQCRGKVLNVILLGLPAATDAEIDTHGRRILSTGWDVNALERDKWRSQAGETTAVSALPARRARSLKQGGEYIVQTDAAGGAVRARRLRVPLPADGAALDQVLTACGQLTEDPRDAFPLANNLMDDEMWAASRLFAVPIVGLAAGATHRADVSCIVAPAGRVRDCQVEGETDPGLGDRVLVDAPQVRIGDGHTADALVDHVIYITVAADVPQSAS